MNFTRNTYAEINLKNIKENVAKIISKYKGYEYYFGVVKANCYGHNDIKTVKAIIDGGCNYLAVATLDEALYIRKQIKEIPILCLGVIPSEYIKQCINENITITVNSLDYAKEIVQQELSHLKIHIKINTGMNRLGINSLEEVKETIEILKEKNVNLEGIYTHIYDANNKDLYLNQKEKFEEIQKEFNQFKIVHMSASDALSSYEKPEFVNGCRLGIIMYGFAKQKSLDLKSTFSVYSEVIQINEIKRGETVGYNGTYIATEEKERIAVVSIGYADGINRKNTGRYVYINDKRYKIVGNVCMDMLFVKIDEDVKLHDKVVILKDIEHIEEVSKYLYTIPYELLCEIGPRVERKYLD